MPQILLTHAMSKQVLSIDPEAIAISNRMSSSGGLITQITTKIQLPDGNPIGLPVLESPETVAALVNEALGEPMPRHPATNERIKSPGEPTH